MSEDVKELARELSAMWDKGHNFMGLAHYAMSVEREACAHVALHHGHASDGQIALDERRGIYHAIKARAE